MSIRRKLCRRCGNIRGSNDVSLCLTRWHCGIPVEESKKPSLWYVTLEMGNMYIRNHYKKRYLGVSQTN